MASLLIGLALLAAWVAIPLLDVLDGRGHEIYSVGQLTKFEAVGASNLDVVILVFFMMAALVLSRAMRLPALLEERSFIRKYRRKSALGALFTRSELITAGMVCFSVIVVYMYATCD